VQTASRIGGILSKLFHYTFLLLRFFVKFFVGFFGAFFREGYKGFRSAAMEDLEKYRREREKRILNQDNRSNRTVKAGIRAIVYFVLLPTFLSLLIIFLPTISIEWIPGGKFTTSSLVIAFAAFIYGLGWASYNPELREMGYRFLAKVLLHEPLVDAHFLSDNLPKNVHTELRYIEKIGYIMIPLMIVLFIIGQIGTYSPSTWIHILAPFFGGISLEKFKAINTVLVMLDLPLAIFFVFIFSTSFRFYYAQLSFKVAKLYEKKYDKMKYYMHGLRDYNKYLAGNLGFRLDNLKIYNKILSKGINDDIVISVFDYNNELKPAEYFMDFTGNDNLILEVKTVEKIRDVVIFIVTILPLAIPILGILFPGLKEILS
jgi:hypothetical protein